MEQLKKELVLCTYKNTPRFTFEGKEYLGKCIGVYDGDTITIAIKPFTNDKIYKYSVRLAGIDTPEIRTKNPREKKRAIEVRDLLREKILNKLIIIKCGLFDKYGRLLGHIYNKNKTENINKWLIYNDLAYVYNGGTKKQIYSKL